MYKRQGLDTAALCVGPAVGGFVEANLLQLQMVAIAVAIGGVEDFKSDPRQVFCGRYAVEQ